MNLFSKAKKNVLVLGSDGMFGSELYAELRNMSARGEIGMVYGMDRPELDMIEIKRKSALSAFFINSRKFDVCVNCIAMTDTKAAENDVAGKRLSYELNALVPKFTAESCAFWKTKFIHISTDYVFDRFGEGGGKFPFRPFATNSTPYPRSVYGTHKLIGEQFVKDAFFSKGRLGDFSICRTSWLYGETGQKSFVHKIIRAAAAAAARGQDGIDVTRNEESVPTSVRFLARFIIEKFVLKWSKGQIFHAVPSVKNRIRPEAPYISRAEWAKTILMHFRQFADEDRHGRLFELMSSDDFVKPVDRPLSFYPEFSAMSPSPWENGSDWLIELNEFMRTNMPSLKALAVKEFETEGARA